MTYVGDEPPQPDEEMEEEVVKQPTGVQRPVMPYRLDRSARIELADNICSLFAREGIPCGHVREIKQG